MVLNTFTSGVNTSFSTELNENFTDSEKWIGLDDKVFNVPMVSGWTQDSSGGGAGTHVTSDFMGYVNTAITDSASNDGVSMTYDSAGFQIGSFSEVVIEFQVLLADTLSASTTIFSVGLSDDSGNNPIGWGANEIGFGWANNNSGTPIANWYFVSKDGGSGNYELTTVNGLTTDVWSSVKFVITSSSIKCYLDGSLEATHTTRIPTTTTALYPKMSLRDVGTTGVDFSSQLRSVKIRMSD